jgi:hypothetical protein
MIRLIQIRKGPVRRVAIVDEPRVRLLANFSSTYALAWAAIAEGARLAELAQRHATTETLDYDAIYQGKSEWGLLPPLDYPDEPARCLVSGTGLTHLGSARDRQAMHASPSDAPASAPEELTDSMKMFRWGVEGGRPPQGKVGAAPEWFYKGVGTILRSHGEPLVVPAFAEDGGEEAEIAGAYLIGPDGHPRRLGMAAGNEFSDHRFEKKNYLNLAGSKLRTCALGPELVVDPEFESVPGRVAIERAGQVLWQKAIRTGQAEMCHSLSNLEHHHFKFDAHRRPGDVHVHFFGAHGLSFGDGLQLTDGDVMEIHFEGFGRPLRNPVQRVGTPEALVAVQPL